MHLDPIRFRYRPDDIVEEEQPRRIGAAAGKGSESLKMPQSPFPRSSRRKPGPRLAGKPGSPNARSSPLPRRQPPQTPPQKPHTPKPRLEEQLDVINALPDSPTSPAATAAAVPPTPNALKRAAYPQSPRESKVMFHTGVP